MQTNARLVATVRDAVHQLLLPALTGARRHEDNSKRVTTPRFPSEFISGLFDLRWGTRGHTSLETRNKWSKVSAILSPGQAAIQSVAADGGLTST